MTHKLLQNSENEQVYAEAGYQGIQKRKEVKGNPINWHVAKRRSQVNSLPEGEEKELVKGREKCKASIRAKVEHPFHIVKNLFRHRKARYKGLAKNNAQLYSLFALANLMLAINILK